MESVGGFNGKGNQLNAYYTATGNPDYFNEDLSRYRALTAADVQAAAEFWLPAGRRAELSVEPATAGNDTPESRRLRVRTMIRNSAARPFAAILVVGLAIAHGPAWSDVRR